MAVGAAACWGLRALCFWATRRLRFPPPWYEQVAPLLLPAFVLLILTCALGSRRWPPLRDFAVGACAAAIVFAAAAVAFNNAPG